MTVQPHSVRFHAPGEIDDLPQHLVSTYTEDTIPNEPCEDFKLAQNIVLKHVQEFIDLDTEDLRIRVAALTCDLGIIPDVEGFAELIDTYKEPMAPAYADWWTDNLKTYIHAHGIGERP